MTTSPRAIEAAVFDMDGTLVDNMGFHATAWLEMAARLGVEGVTVERFETHYAGQRNEEIFPDLLQRAIAPDELARLAEEKEQLYRDRATPYLKEVAGLTPFLELLDGRGVKLAVATAAPPKNRELALRVLQFEKRFAVVVGAEDVTRGKPHPDLYLAAAERLGLAPSACVAFEDAPNGVRAAVAAGMACVGVVTTTPALKLTDVGAFCTLERFDTLPEALRTMLGLG